MRTQPASMESALLAALYAPRACDTPFQPDFALPDVDSPFYAKQEQASCPFSLAKVAVVGAMAG